MNERIKKLRKALGLTLEKFGERLGVQKSAVSKWERSETGVSEQVFKSICREFNVNKEWLRNGTGSMFVQPDTFSLDNFVKSKGATDLELEIVKTYFELDPEIRRAAMEHFKHRLISAVAADPALLAPDTPEELEALCPPVDICNASNENAG